MAKLANIHPGEILLEEFLAPMSISQNKLARDIEVPPRRINEIVHGNRAISADTDLRLSKALGTSEGFWLGLQADYDLEERRKIIKQQLNHIHRLYEGVSVAT
ncbi:MAG: HigA family addiction module antidote protein [Gammaproteobacteria bacterium]|nr:HigA family addiction module antidote protein [Gammaproteobacteria bacterium]